MSRIYCFLSRGFFALVIVFLILANFSAPELRAESSSGFISCDKQTCVSSDDTTCTWRICWQSGQCGCFNDVGSGTTMSCQCLGA
jgi:hypothetical protein